MGAAFFLVSRGLPGPGRPAFRPGIFRTLHLAHFRPRGLGCAVALYTWASRGETLVPTLAAQTVLRVRSGRPLRGPCIYLACGRSTCAELASRVDTKVSHDDTVEWKESRGVVPSSAPAAARAPGRCGSDGGCPVAEHLPRACAGVPTMLPRASARPTRASGFGRAFGAHPRGEFRTSERPQAT